MGVVWVSRLPASGRTGWRGTHLKVEETLALACRALARGTRARQHAEDEGNDARLGRAVHDLDVERPVKEGLVPRELDAHPDAAAARHRPPTAE